jgi:hypothetical protein
VFKFKFEALPEMSWLDELLADTCKFLLLTFVVKLLEELVERLISSAINLLRDMLAEEDTSTEILSALIVSSV